MLSLLRRDLLISEFNFIGFVNTLLATDPAAQGKLIVRRNRDIGKGTGTLLSPTDRNLGDTYPDDLVLTMYKITGNKAKGVGRNTTLDS